MSDNKRRWQERFVTYQKALKRLSDNVETATERELSTMEQEGLVKSFEFVWERAWNVIKDFYTAQGEADKIEGSRDAILLAINRKLIKNGDIWMEMLKDRNQTSHIYNEAVADRIAASITTQYYGEFEKVREELQKRIDEEGK